MEEVRTGVGRGVRSPRFYPIRSRDRLPGVMEPQQLGPYRLTTRLGRGGMGAVYEGVNDQTGEPVAVKILASHLADDSGLRQRFEAEIETLKPLRAAGIVKLLAYGEEEGQPYFAMELVRGKSLEQLVRGGRPFSWQETVALASDIVRSLKVAHDHGIIHRDLKPANLLVADDPATAGAAVKLADFGIAKLFGTAGHTAHGSIVGTAEYMAPEQAAGRPLDARADLYALGLVMFTMLTGKPPFRGTQLTQIISQQLHEKAPRVGSLVQGLPAELDQLISQLLEKDPANRPASALAVGRRLTAIADAASAIAKQEDGPPEPNSPTETPADISVVVRPQADPAAPTHLQRSSQPTDQTPASPPPPQADTGSIDLLAATRDATRAAAAEPDSSAEADGPAATTEPPLANTAATTDLPVAATADADAATHATQDFTKPESQQPSLLPLDKRPTRQATGRNAVADATHRGSSGGAADTIVDRLPSNRFVTVAELDRVSDEQAARSQVRQARLQLVVVLTTIALATCVGYLLLKPPTADELYAKIAATSQSPIGDLRDVRWQIDRFLRQFPDDSRHGEVAGLAQTIKLDALEKRARRRILGDRAVPAIERDYRSAMAREAESPSAAVAALEALGTLHPMPEGTVTADASLAAEDHALWLALAQRQLERLSPLAEQEQTEDRRRADALLAEADALAATAASDPEAAVRRRSLLESLIATYADRPHAAAAVAAAREQLRNE